MTNRRVVITGVGLINALGVGKEQYFQAMLKGATGVTRIKSFDPIGFASQVAGESPEVKMSAIVPKSQRKSTKLMSRDIELAVAAADCAVRDAGLKTKASHPDGPVDIDPVRSGVNIGAGLICCDLVELAEAVQHGIENNKFSMARWGREGMQQLTPLWLLKYLPNMLSCHISIIYDLQGKSNSITCAEVSGLLAISEAYRNIAHGKADFMLAGGAECKVNPMALMRQCMLNRASTHYNDRPAEAARPFDKDADGNVVGDGAAIVVLEELEHARGRGATIYAEIKGAGASINFDTEISGPEDISRDTKVDSKGIEIAISQSIRGAGLAAGDIDLLIPHGLGLARYDKAEAQAIGSVFGAGVGKVRVLATKSRIGNCGAGAAAIDLVTAVLAMKERTIPANLNCPNQPEEYKLNMAGANVSDVDINNAMISCYSYGGQTAAMVISKWQ